MDAGSAYESDRTKILFGPRGAEITLTNETVHLGPYTGADHREQVGQTTVELRPIGGADCA
jgi:hypothetical protein